MVDQVTVWGVGAVSLAAHDSCGARVAEQERVDALARAEAEMGRSERQR